MKNVDRYFLLKKKKEKEQKKGEVKEAIGRCKCNLSK